MFISLLAAMQGDSDSRNNLFGFPEIKSAVCVLVDGLGVANLEARAGHAPALSKLLAASKSIRCEFPSTTVVSLAGLLTGKRSNVHGLIGYNVLDTKKWGLANLLSGWEQTGEDALEWKMISNLAEHSGEVVVDVVAHPDYEHSGFTKLTMAGAIFHGVQDLEDRVFRAISLGSKKSHLVYLYIPELDQLGHRFGSASTAWSEALEQLDAALRPLLDSNIPVVLTADHGMVDVPIENQIHLDSIDALTRFEFLAGGDTRSSFIYFKKPEPEAKQVFRDALGDTAWVCDWDELVDAGYLSGDFDPRIRIPDLVLLARQKVTLYDRRTCKPRSLAMLGHHGSISDQEMRVPLLLAGSLA